MRAFAGSFEAIEGWREYPIALWWSEVSYADVCFRCDNDQRTWSTRRVV